jgi:hypothetical protein
VEGEMPGVILNDQERRMFVGHVVVPPRPDRDALEQVITAE